MKYHDIKFQKFIFINVILLCLIFPSAIYSQQYADVKLRAIDNKGNPLPQVKVVVSEGMIYAETDENGYFSFSASPEDLVTLSLSGYEKTIIFVKELIAEPEITLIKAKLFMSSEDDIPLPFITLKKRHLTGSSNVIKGDVLDKYPTTDLRNALTGLASGLEVIENSGAPGMSAIEQIGLYGAVEKVSLYTRGRSPVFIIDDMPVDITELQLDPQEIESVTVIKDIVAKTMYGPAAANGIIFIKTKRGLKNDRIINVNAENGISVIDRFPQWASGADYARLNNQARLNDGLLPQYSDEDIEKYENNDAYDMYHPNINFREMMLKDMKSFKRVNISYQGGDNVAQYFANINYNGDGDIYKIGSEADFNRIGSRANLDIKVNDPISIRFDFYGGLTFRRSPSYGYSAAEGSGAMNHIEFDRVIDDITSISPVAFPVYANNDPSLKTPWFAVNAPTFPNNPIGRMIGNGYYNEKGRNAILSSSFIYDMSNIIPGLKSKTHIEYNTYNLIRIGKAVDYTAYNAIQSTTGSGADTILLEKVRDGIAASDESKLHDFYYENLGVYENLSYDKSFGNNNLQTSLTYFLFKKRRDGFKEPLRQQNLVWTGVYSFKDKYSIQGVLNYAGTFSFDQDERYALFPAIGANWVVSDESFMSGLTFINFLKLRIETGILGYEEYPTPYYYRDNWIYNTTGTQFGPAPTGFWFGNSTETAIPRNRPGRIGNPDITWEKRKEFNLGFDALLFNQKLSLEANYYNHVRDGILIRPSQSLPNIIGISGSLPWTNFNKIRYYGLETSIRFADKVGSIKYSLGGSFTFQNSEVLKYDEPAYRFDYQSRVGKPVDAIYGQTYTGKFQSDAEAQSVQQIYDEVLYEGDLKYMDINQDGFIDENDNSMIGHSSPRLFYALDARLSYENFDLTIIGTGRALYDISLTNNYFWNGWGDNNYSAFVKDNIGEAYPRLTYYKVNNNFINSDFWLTKGGYFKIQNIELAYNVPVKMASILKANGIRIFLRGANLFTFSGIKEVDPESISAGIQNYPLFRTFSGGIKLTF